MARYVILDRSGYGSKLGETRSNEAAKKLILKKGRLLEKYNIIRVMPSGVETRLSTYQVKLSGYRGRGPRKLVSVN